MAGLLATGEQSKNQGMGIKASPTPVKRPFLIAAWAFNDAERNDGLLVFWYFLSKEDAQGGK